LENHFGVHFNIQSAGNEDEGDIAAIELGSFGLLAYGRLNNGVRGEDKADHIRATSRAIERWRRGWRVEGVSVET